MIEKILPDLYRLEIPLPNTPLKSINSYLIKGEGRNLLIDTGLNHKQCLDAMHLELKELGVDLRETDIFITHAHSDHSGLVSSLTTDTSTIFCGKQDSYIFDPIITTSNVWDDIREFTERHGFPETELNLAVEAHPGFKYSSRGGLNHTKLTDGDMICAGSYRFRCIETPGHTKGHMCLYEPDRKFLVAGDHILGNITPNISQLSDNDNPLKEYLQSLIKINNYDIELVLPGHRDLITNCHDRIRELTHHYEKRAAEVLVALEKGDRTGYQAASELSWNLTYESWELFPPAQKMFATWETLAHLKYMEEKQLIKRELVDQRVVFSLGKQER